MASIMRLRPEHKRHHVITSPLVANAKEMSEDQIKAVVQTYYDNPTTQNRDAAIMAFGSIIRYITARFLGAFRSMSSLEDDLITRGFMIVMDVLESRIQIDAVCRTVSNRILWAQTQEVHNTRAMGTVSFPTQKRRVSKGDAALYVVAINEEHESFDFDPSLGEFELYRSMIEREDLTELERSLLHPVNWAQPTKDLAEKYGVTDRTIRRAISRLITIAREELYAD